ncbi:hypothetical protein ABZ353_10960 [Streptomyces niveus]|uniref:hypothetical protein n=1 Tax=Streptomyces niveus TaxID=193462 RepID=UPI0033E88C8C
MKSRDGRVAELQELDSWTLSERIVDLEDALKVFMELDDARLKQIEKLKADNKTLAKLFIDKELDPSRLESALRMYVAELDYDIHKGIECGEEDEQDHYPEEVEFFLRCWETAGEN